jgi:hypothetical protein
MLNLAVDASDYSVGGYLYQIIDGLQRRIKHLSKLLDSTQQVAHRRTRSIRHGVASVFHLEYDQVFKEERQCL